MVDRAVLERHCYILENFSQRVGYVFVRLLKQAMISPIKAWRLDNFPEPYWYLHSFMLESTEQKEGLGCHFLASLIEQIEPAQGTILLYCWAGNDKLRNFYAGAGFTVRGLFQKDNYEVAVYFVLLKESQRALPTCRESEKDRIS